MATRQFQLSEDKIRAFRQAEAQTRDARELKRLQAVRLYGMGEAVTPIQKVVGCDPLSPRQWAIRYKRGGLDALRGRWATGNANKLTSESSGRSWPKSLSSTHLTRCLGQTFA